MGLYRLLMAVLAPFFASWAFGLWVIGRERLGDLRERLCLAAVPEGTGPTLWFHAASNGELASAEEVIRALQRADPALRLLITTNSVTGRDLARRWDLPRATARLAPFDWQWATRRLLRRSGVIGLVILEAEFWPNRILVAARRNIPVCVIGARLSRRSARQWRRALWLTRPVLANITWVLPQDNGSRRRLRRLGMDPVRLGSVTDLKALYAAAGKPDPDPALMAAFPRARTWLAASTHPGEEEIVLAAHRAALAFWPDLELILAPRHPKRADDVRALVGTAGFACAQRSRGEPPRGGHVYLVDTLGEMPRFYANAAICLVAGSLVDRGGHTPFEPAAFDCAILHGPYLRNFQAVYRALDVAGAALQTPDAESLALALGELRDPARRAALVHNARSALGRDIRPEPVAEKLLNLVGRPVHVT